MAYSNNPYAPKARRAAVDLVIRQGMSAAEAAPERRTPDDAVSMDGKS